MNYLYQIIKYNVFWFQGIVKNPNGNKHDVDEDKNEDKQYKMNITHHLKQAKTISGFRFQHAPRSAKVYQKKTLTHKP